MKFGDRVRYSDQFKEKFGEQWPPDMDGEGVVLEAGDNPRTGQQVCLVMWDRDEHSSGWLTTRSPQVASTSELTKLGETPPEELEELRDRAESVRAQWGV